MKKKLLTMILASAMILSCFAGCGKTETKQTEESKKTSVADQTSVTEQSSTVKEEPVKEKVTIQVGNWPTEDNAAEFESMNKRLEEFTEANPDIEVVPVPWGYDAKAYLAQAASGQIPTTYEIYFTEIDRVISAGFAKDVTEAAKEFGWYDMYTDQMREMIFRDGGKLYMLPVDCYAMGLQINKNVFEAAGLVNADGTVMVPETYDDVLEFSKIIKEKTGAYGFLIPTKGASGGWRFINLAWSFGTNFMEKVDGKWKATFDSEELAAALQYVKDFKYEYDLMPEDVLIAAGTLQELFAQDKLGMLIEEPLGGTVITKYGFAKEDLVYASLPEGPGGRYVQMGGTLQVIDRNATDAQVEACFRWLDFIGRGPKLTEDSKASIIAEQDTRLETGLIVGIKPLSVWVDGAEITKFTLDTINEKKNVDPKNFEHFGLSKATMRPEEPVNCAELYQVLSSCLQEVLSDKDSEPKKVLEKAAADFQMNSLDNVDY